MPFRDVGERTEDSSVKHSAARYPRREANHHLPGGFDACVLEPSPPAEVDTGWYADDPTDPAGSSGLVTPIPGEGVTWSDLAECDSRVAAFAHDHWLDGTRPLDPLPDTYDTTRRALHQVAFFAVAPMRFAHTGKLGLRYTSGGFGTPFFIGASGIDEQVRVEADFLLHQIGDDVRTTKITTLDAATQFLGLTYQEEWFDAFHDPLAPTGQHVPLEVDPVASASVGDWFGFATHVFERFRRSGAEEISRVQLWPEHFDPAVEAGSSEQGQRASYGASPGDDGRREPYLYVTPWSEVDGSDPYWNAESFTGAVLGHNELRAAPDPYRVALEFLEAGLEKLTQQVAGNAENT